MDQTNKVASKTKFSLGRRNGKVATLRNAALKALVLSVAVYPLAVVMISMVNLFQNQSFGFAGYELSVALTDRSASASLVIRPEFLVSMIVMFAVSTVVVWVIEKLLEARRERAC